MNATPGLGRKRPVAGPPENGEQLVQSGEPRPRGRKTRCETVFFRNGHLRPRFHSMWMRLGAVSQNLGDVRQGAYGTINLETPGSAGLDPTRTSRTGRRLLKSRRFAAVVRSQVEISGKRCVRTGSVERPGEPTGTRRRYGEA